MLFHQPEFALLICATLVLFWALVHYPHARTGILLLASYVFYMSWSPTYALLILFATGLNFLCGARIHAAPTRAEQRRFLWISVVGSLGLLAYFKYRLFFYDMTSAGMGLLGVQMPVWSIKMLLPVGISFYTFQTLSYTIDIYRGELEPEPSFFRFALYVSFFPQLVAGPIVRARDFLPQLRRPPRLGQAQIALALSWISFGLLKKVVIADYLAVNLVDRVFTQPHLYTSLEVLAGIYGYAFQIYCDFSGYSDVAIGAAMLFGLSLPLNFNQPYLALGLRDFWRRWHITLSTWLRDYLYIPLGGSRHGVPRMLWALMVTMVLGGLWHGANYTFLIWGTLHGLLLCLEHLAVRVFGLRGVKAPLWASILGRILTFHLVCLGWVFFRAQDLKAALAVLGRLGKPTVVAPNLTAGILLVLALALVSHLWPRRQIEWLQEAMGRLPAPVMSVALGLLLALVSAAVMALRSAKVVPFIYFQF